MWLRIGRTAALAALVSALAAFVATSAASADATIQFKNWAVWGSITDKKLNEAVTLPKGTVFNGAADLTSSGGGGEVAGTIKGHLTVPPFKTMLKLLGLLPAEAGIKITEVGESSGTIVTIPASNCAHSDFPGVCVKTTVVSKATLGITSAGDEGLELPLQCETAEPLTLELSGIGTSGELPEQHYKGEVTIPSITCGGLEGLVLGPLLTTLMSGPENPYVLSLASHEPTAPSVSIAEPALPPRSVSQVSAILEGLVVPEGEPLTSCEWEYGTTESYGSSVPCDIPPQTLPYTQILLSGLHEATTYHFRLTASNSYGTSHSSDGTFTTLTAASAPEYGQCVSKKKGGYTSSNCAFMGKGSFAWKPGPAPTCVEKKKGEYTNSTCTVKSGKRGKGHFERAPGPGYALTTGSVTLQAGENILTCTSGSGSGDVTGVHTGSEQITLSGCESAGNPCTSEGPDGTASGTSGAIETNKLATRLLGPVETRLSWTQLSSSEHEPYVAEFACGSKRYRIKGTLAGLQGGDVGAMSTTSTTTFNSASGEQALSTEVSENGGSSWLGPDSSILTAVATSTAASSIEIKP